jgi:hypothetical protein
MSILERYRGFYSCFWHSVSMLLREAMKKTRKACEWCLGSKRIICEDSKGNLFTVDCDECQIPQRKKEAK